MQVSMSVAQKKSRIYFTRALALPDGAVVLAGHMQEEDDDPTFTRLVLFNKGAWGLLGDMQDVVYALAGKPNPGAARPNLCVMGRLGTYREYVAGSKPVDQRIAWRDVTYLESLALIDGSLYVCGGQRQVARQSANGWDFVDSGLFEPFTGRLQCALLSIDGFSAQKIISVGLDGAAWLWDGSRWSALDSPTNVTLNAIKCTSSGDAYICGDGGTLYRLDAALNWIDLSDRQLSDRPFWDLAIYGDHVYVAAENRLLRTDGRVLEDVALGLTAEPYLFGLSAGRDRLWCVGDENVYEFDGSSVTVHVCPDNR
jgi:hypothetical protein